MSQPHRAARLERHVRDAVEQQLGSRGWTPRVVPFTGYGSTGAGGTGWVRVLARVLLAPPGTPRATRTDGRGWRRFVSTSAAGVAITIEVAGRNHTVTSGPDGYVDARLDADVGPGWTTVVLRVADADPVHAPVRVVGPTTTLGLLSDLDDTVIVTMLPRPLLAFRNAFLVREDERRSVSGMAELYDEVVAGSADVFVVYLSTGAWNTARPMTAFLDRHGFPAGPLLMTDWGPTSDGWFRSGQDHKRS
ncbi:phosphatase domain-containing protein, partial [Nocardioides sp.]|uniref:phosphatase domain-containing protein n=1 Tax=Nocardioides sp. TaxID=35761 RepID=UPI00286CC372